MDYQTYMNDLFLKNAKSGRIISQLRATLGSLPIVLKALMDRSKKKIRVVTSASTDTGSTDLKTKVILPMVPLPTREDDVGSYVDIAALLYGLIHHEVGHINDTAPGYMEQCQSKLHCFILNVIEDVRQELLHIKRFPGARPYLNALAMVMHKRGQMSVPSAQDGPVAVFTAFLLFRLYAEFRKDPVAIDQYPATKAVAEQVFPNGFIVRISPIIAKFNGVNSTHAAFIMSQELMAFLQQEREEAQKQQQASDPSSGDDSDPSDAGNGDDSDPSDTGDDSTQGDTADQSDGNDGQPGSNADDPSAPSDDQASSGSSDQDTGDDGNVDGQGSGSDDQGTKDKTSLDELLDDPDMDSAMSGIHEQAREQLEDLVGEKKSDPSYDVASSELLGDIEASQERLHTGRQHDLRQATSVAGPLRRKLLSQLDALTNPNKRAAAKGRKLSGRHLSRIISGDPRVFEVRDDGYEVDTAVLLLQDVSGSMAGQKIEVASQALYATALSMSGIDGLQLSAITFPGNSWVIKPNESARRNQARFALSEWGFTPMTEAIQLGTRMLMQSGKVRKLMIVLTDGQADNHDTAATAIAVAQSQGIEVYGIGILTPQHRDLFERWTTITDLLELPEKLSAMVRDKVFDRLAA